MATETQEIPVIGTAITSFEAAGLVESNEEPGGNVSGVNDETPIADQMALLKEIFPDAQSVGLSLIHISAGGTPIEFPTIGICDGIAQGNYGMHYPLASRELIADSVECMMNGHSFDAMAVSYTHLASGRSKMLTSK